MDSLYEFKVTDIRRLDLGKIILESFYFEKNNLGDVYRPLISKEYIIDKKTYEFINEVKNDISSKNYGKNLQKTMYQIIIDVIYPILDKLIIISENIRLNPKIEDIISDKKHPLHDTVFERREISLIHNLCTTITLSSDKEFLLTKFLYRCIKNFFSRLCKHISSRVKLFSGEDF